MANVPVLRFPEFSADWSIERLDTIAKIERGKFTPRPRNDPKFYGGSIPFVQTSDVTLSNGKIEKYTQTLNDEGLKVSKLFPKGTILITIAANIGYSGVLQIDMACPDSLIGIRCKKNINNQFVNYYLQTQQPKLDYLAPEAAQRNINLEFLAPYPIPVTALEEQQKIANFLTTVDTKIQQLQQKQTLLQQYKKGVMQQLFSQALRFKDDEGGDYPDWEEKRLGDVAKIYDGTHTTPKYTKTGIPFYSVEHLTRKDFTNTKFISEEVFEKENKRVKLEKGDILMTRIGDIGTSVYLGWEVRASFYVSLALIKQSPDHFNSSFMHQFIESDGFQRELYKRTIHVAFPKKINLGEIGNCSIELPCLKEQQKIANFLTAIDEKITQTTQQLEQSQTFKKGLLQQMFV